MLMVAGAAARVRPILGDLRLQLGDKFKLRETDELKFLWVVEFPACSSTTKRRSGWSRSTIRSPRRIPTTSACWTRPRCKARALAYDMVLNGEELGGGSIRIHNPELQLKVFELLGLSA